MKNCHKWYTCLYKNGETPEEVYSSDIKNILGHLRKQANGVWDRTNRVGLGTEQMGEEKMKCFCTGTGAQTVREQERRSYEVSSDWGSPSPCSLIHNLDLIITGKQAWNIRWILDALLISELTSCETSFMPALGNTTAVWIGGKCSVLNLGLISSKNH